MKKNYDAAVIGGGIIGLSCAYYLLLSGKKVVLIEKNHIGSGASGACDDMILLQSKQPGISLELALQSLEMYRRLSGELDIDIEFQSRGGMILIENSEQQAIMEDYVDKQRSCGLQVEIIGKDEVRKKHPFVKKEIKAATYSDRDSQVNPLKVMRGFMARGADMGLEIMRKKNITNLRQMKDYWKIEFDGGGYVESEYIINATGAWSVEIGKMVDIDIPIYPQKGQIAVTESIPPLGKENIWSAGYIVSKLRPDLIKNKSDIYSKLGIGFSLSQTKEGNYFIGSTREKNVYDKENTFEALNILISQGVDFYEIFKNVHIIRCFAGLRPVTIDGKPIISEVENRKGLFIASGHGGDGIALAPITGKLISKLINNESIDFNLRELSLQRFNINKEVEINFSA